MVVTGDATRGQERRSSALRFLCRLVAALAVTVMPWACAAPEGGSWTEAEATSLHGDPLAVRPDTSGAIAAADSALAEDPTDIERIIASANTYASLWRFHDAIALYTQAIALAPKDARLYRQRGHRYISIRDFERAANDLDIASSLDSSRFDIEYHRGLAHYLLGHFDRAVEIYDRCTAAAGSAPGSRIVTDSTEQEIPCSVIGSEDEARVAITEWHYRALRRVGRHVDASKLLETIRPDIKVVSNRAYRATLLFYRGGLTEPELLAAAARDSIRFETIGAGLGTWKLAQGDTAGARAMFTRVLEDPHWPGFGYIAAEVEMRRLGK
jgi:tetratricopeptide (TPR) repeat protein